MSGIPSIDRYALPTAQQLPANVAHWTIDPGRAVLLIHDMQRYFLRPFAHAGLDTLLIEHAVALRDYATAKGIPVAYTAQPGGMTPAQRGLLKDFWGAGMQIDPADRSVVDELAPRPHDWLLPKWRYSAFWNSDFLARMREAGRDQLIIAGVYAHIGILTTAIESFSHDIETFLVADAIADFSLEHHLMALHHAARCCAVVLTTDQVLA